MSELKVNKISPRTACGTVTLGDSGDTIAIGAGVTTSGMGRTGTVDWDTSIKTGTVTAVSGSGYFVNTTAGAITVNLPVGAVGSIVAVSDYASTSASNQILINPNGSEKINGVNDDYRIGTAGLAVTLVYADATKGWKSVTGSDADATGEVPAWVTATGGTIATVCTNYKTHTFTSPGTFVVTCAGNTGGSNALDYLIVAGGGGGGSNGGGGGAGGFRESVPSPAAWTASPLANPGGSLTAVATPYAITVGAGGGGSPSSPTCGVQGSDSIFSTITSAGGGKAGGWGYPGGGAGDGGSGGGGGMDAPGSPAVLIDGGAGDTPDVTPDQGKGGGQGWHQAGVSSWGGGGGGATVAGFNGTPAEHGGNGGTGATTSISATPTAYAGGGAGRPHTPTSGTGGTGGGGASGGPASPSNVGVAGTVNTGGGGGGSNNSPPQIGGNGGSGIVIIRYKFQ